MADCEDAADASMSDQIVYGDDVFIENGDTDTRNGCGMLHPEYGSSDKVLPRRSSLVKDPSRRQQQRKKTVSFSSMPNDRTIVNGKRAFTF